jgi:hypothetical protein
MVLETTGVSATGLGKGVDDDDDDDDATAARGTAKREKKKFCESSLGAASFIGRDAPRRRIGHFFCGYIFFLTGAVS